MRKWSTNLGGLTKFPRRADRPCRPITARACPPLRSPRAARSLTAPGDAGTTGRTRASVSFEYDVIGSDPVGEKAANKAERERRTGGNCALGGIPANLPREAELK